MNRIGSILMSVMVSGILLLGVMDAAVGGGRMPSKRGIRIDAPRLRGPFAMLVASTEFEARYYEWNAFYKRTVMATSRGVGERIPEPFGWSREAWYVLLDQFYENPPAEFAKDTNWKNDMAAMTGWIHLAEWELYAGKWEEAHETLNNVRRRWMEMRERNGIAWFADEIIQYYDVMAPVVNWGEGNERGGVTEENIEAFEQAVDEMIAAWGRLSRFPFRPGNPRRFTFVRNYSGAALYRLRQVVAERRYEDIPEASREVRTGFIQLYMGFG